jgi:hypothetical protein
MPRGMEIFRDLVYEPTRAEQVKIKGRLITQEFFYFRNPDIERFIFNTTDRFIVSAGISLKARDNWVDRIAQGRLPELDKDGNLCLYMDFFAFERYVQAIYSAARADRKLRRQVER